MKSATVSASGALLSNTELHTTVGGYAIDYTSSGGLMISGGGVALQVSSGAVVASADNGDDGANIGTVLSMTSNGGVISGYNIAAGPGHEYRANINGGGIVASGANGEIMSLSAGTATIQADDGEATSACLTLHSGGINLHAETTAGTGDVDVTSDGVLISDGDATININSGAVLINSRPVLTELVTSTDTETTVVSGGVLSGGTSIIYTQPLMVFGFDSITSGARAEFDFTAASGATLAFASGAGINLIGISSLDSGTHYFVAVDGARARVVVNSYTVVGE